MLWRIRFHDFESEPERTGKKREFRSDASDKLVGLDLFHAIQIRNQVGDEVHVCQAVPYLFSRLLEFLFAREPHDVRYSTLVSIATTKRKVWMLAAAATPGVC